MRRTFEISKIRVLPCPPSPMDAPGLFQQAVQLFFPVNRFSSTTFNGVLESLNAARTTRPCSIVLLACFEGTDPLPFKYQLQNLDTKSFHVIANVRGRLFDFHDSAFAEANICTRHPRQCASCQSSLGCSGDARLHTPMESSRFRCVSLLKESVQIQFIHLEVCPFSSAASGSWTSSNDRLSEKHQGQSSMGWISIFTLFNSMTRAQGSNVYRITPETSR